MTVTSQCKKNDKIKESKTSLIQHIKKRTGSLFCHFLTCKAIRYHDMQDTNTLHKIQHTP